jgi:nicotinamidase-related amidase
MTTTLKTFKLGASALIIAAALSLGGAIAQERPADIISPITDKVAALEVSAADAKAAGRFAYNKPTPENSIMLFIDHQIGLMAGVRDFTSLAEYKNNVTGLAKMAKAMNIPVMLTTSNAQWQNGDILPELKTLFADQPIYRRTGIINAYEDPTFRAALQKLMKETGRTHVIISGVTLGTCVTFPTLSMLNDGYTVIPVVDASGAWSKYEAEAAMSRMSAAGAELHSVFALGAELQADWKNESATAMLDPFVQNLPEYGFVLQNYWNNANQQVVADPFGLVK